MYKFLLIFLTHKKQFFFSTGLLKSHCQWSSPWRELDWEFSPKHIYLIQPLTGRAQCYFSLFNCSQKKLRSDGKGYFKIVSLLRDQMSCSLSCACGMWIMRTYTCTCPLPLNSPAESEIYVCSMITCVLNCLQKLPRLWELNGKTNYDKNQAVPCFTFCHCTHFSHLQQSSELILLST